MTDTQTEAGMDPMPRKDVDLPPTKREAELLTRIAELEAGLEKLQDPNAVHANMLAGKIAKPSWVQIQHLYPREAAQSVRVKPLEWPEFSEGMTYLQARQAPFGRPYSVRRYTERAVWTAFFDDQKVGVACAGIEAAKAAAQADYERRILSAIEEAGE